MLLSRESILNASDMAYEDVHVPEWGGEIRIRSLTGEERDAFEAGLVRQSGKKTKADLNNLRAKLVAACAIAEDGTKLFQPMDVYTLGEKNAAALDRVFEVAQRLSGLNDEDVEDMAEDFEKAPSGASTSA